MNVGLPVENPAPVTLVSFPLCIPSFPARSLCSGLHPLGERPLPTLPPPSNGIQSFPFLRRLSLITTTYRDPEGERELAVTTEGRPRMFVQQVRTGHLSAAALTERSPGARHCARLSASVITLSSHNNPTRGRTHTIFKSACMVVTSVVLTHFCFSC